MTDRRRSGLPWDFRTSDNLEKIASCESEEAIQKIRHSDEQIVRILREPDNEPIPELAKRHRMNE